MARSVCSGETDAPVVIVLRQTGRAFCAGGDLDDIMGAPSPDQRVGVLASHMHESLLLLRDHGVMLLSVVEGAAAGAGLGLVLNSDVVIATNTARFVSSYKQIGVTPDLGVSVLLAKAVGANRANQMLLLHRLVDAPTALDWGLVSQLVDSDDLEETVARVVDTLVKEGPEVLRAYSRLLRPQAERDELARQFEAERERIMTLFAQADTKERIARVLARA